MQASDRQNAILPLSALRNRWSRIGLTLYALLIPFFFS
jgi:hypothetical protein